jgi:iron complex outermembrane receptor protein
VNWSIGLDLNRTRLHHLGTDAFGNPFLTAQGIAAIITAFPRSKLILDAFWRLGKWDVNIRQMRFGQTSDMVTYHDQAPATLRYSSTQFYPFTNTPVG